MVPDPPDTIDLSGGGGLWPAFAITGATGATAANTTYALQPYGGSSYQFTAANGATCSGSAGEWSIETSSVERFTGDGEWPWSAQTWTPVNGAGGTLSFARKLAAPGSIAQGGAASASPAQMTTNLTGANNDLAFESLVSGRIGNDQRVRYVNPGTNNATLLVVVSDHGRDVTVNLATNGSAQITSTAQQVSDAINGSGDNEMLSATNAAGNDGTGVVTAMAWTNLSGGLGGLPLPPSTITL